MLRGSRTAAALQGGERTQGLLWPHRCMRLLSRTPPSLAHPGTALGAHPFDFAVTKLRCNLSYSQGCKRSDCPALGWLRWSLLKILGPRGHPDQTRRECTSCQPCPRCVSREGEACSLLNLVNVHFHNVPLSEVMLLGTCFTHSLTLGGKCSRSILWPGQGGCPYLVPPQAPVLPFR